MQKERNIGSLLIANAAATTVATGSNVDAELSGMFTGETVITSPAGVILDAATASTLVQRFKIATKLTSGKLQWSDIIDATKIKSIQVNSYVAPTLQLDYIGYNGTSGSIEVIDENHYYVRLYLQPLDSLGFAKQRIKWGIYKSDTNATQAEIASGVIKSLITNFSREAEKIRAGIDTIKFELVNSGTSTATSGGTIALVKGSQYVTILGTGADAGQYNADGATIVAGDYLRIGHATTKTFPVYKVTEVVSGGGATTMVVKIDVPYQGTSNSALAAASAGVIPAASLGDFGIKLTGAAFGFDVPKFNYHLPRWKTTLEDFGSTAITNSTKTTEGLGDYKQISQLEQQFQGNEGNFYRAQVPYPTFRSEVSASKTYAVIVIEHTDEMSGNLGNNETSLKQTYIACEKSAGTCWSDPNVGLGTTIDAIITKYVIPTNSGGTAALIVA
jgi:hypothetical protein